MDMNVNISSTNTSFINGEIKGGVSIGFITAYPPDKGRLIDYAYMLIKHLVDLNPALTVTVFSDLPFSSTGGRVNVVSSWRPDYPLSLAKLFGKILKYRPRILVFNVHMAVFGRSRVMNFLGFSLIFLLNILRRLLSYRTVVILHNIPECIKIEAVGMKLSLPNRVGFLLAEKMALTCNTVIVLMRSYVTMLRRRFRKNNITYIPHGAWIWNTPNTPRDNRDSIVFIGYLSPTKDIYALVKAFLKVRSKYPWLKLVIAGSSHPNFPETREYLEKIKYIEGIKFLGYLPDENIPRVLAQALAVVLPYKTTTGTSGVLHLVSSAGVPIIAPPIEEFKELYREGAGIFFSEVDPMELSKAIKVLIEDRDLWRKLSMRSVNFASSRSWERIAYRFNRVLVELAK